MDLEYFCTRKRGQTSLRLEFLEPFSHYSVFWGCPRVITAGLFISHYDRFTPGPPQICPRQMGIPRGVPTLHALGSTHPLGIPIPALGSRGQTVKPLGIIETCNRNPWNIDTVKVRLGNGGVTKKVHMGLPMQDCISRG